MSDFYFLDRFDVWIPFVVTVLDTFALIFIISSIAKVISRISS